ncbi:zinc finger protein 425-like [Homalodisca vitripennis]|uniref:zinc finger protein 425-like n=1 Tax=Homalodisca vitripennis TaxID=197043 RepID=UPI001EEB9460|nr:zinc finger protein 425-like [Homalodisca vitripennis]
MGSEPGYKVVHEAGKSKFVCLPCGRSYSRKPNLNQHQRYQCGKEPQFSCPWCPHRTWTKGNLKAHMGAKHTQNILEKDALDRASRRLLGIHICGGCGKKYSRKDNMTRHQRYECNMDPQFACPHCPYKAKQKGTLKSHMYRRHTCGKCGKEYTLKHNLVRHVRFECGKDPQFQCPQCPYKAKQKGTLKSHVLLKHKDFLLTSGVKFGTSGRAGSIC